MDILVIAGVDVSHLRLVDLAVLADQAKPFYDWVEKQFQAVLGRAESLDTLLNRISLEQIRLSIEFCYQASGNLPLLFDGVGRSYSHQKACFYFFAWLIRDAPQQRLSPLIVKITKNSGMMRIQAEIDTLSRLIVAYRDTVKTFSWEAVREVIIDRLEGSRRSIKGHEREAIVRKALIMAIQDYFTAHQGYGMYQGVEISEKQVTIGNETFDLGVDLLDAQSDVVNRILIPIKTRETEGGGHTHLFTRDILSALQAVQAYLMVVIVAKNWSKREMDTLADVVDRLIVIDVAPSEFITFDKDAQIGLNKFIVSVFNGDIKPKSRQG
jgi:hypothetical protein